MKKVMTTKLIRNQRGFTMIGGLMAVMAMLFIGMSVIQVTSGTGQTSVQDIQGSQAFYASGAGIEYCKRLLDYGYACDGIQKSFQNGSFLLTTIPDSRIITSVGTVGVANKTQTITTDFSGNAV